MVSATFSFCFSNAGVLSCSLELTARRFHESLRLLSACQMDRGEKSLRSSFFGPCDWKKLGRREELQRNQSQIERPRHFWRQKAEGQQRAKAMTFLEADYWSPLTPLQAYESDPETFSRDLYDLKSCSSRNSRKIQKIFSHSSLSPRFFQYRPQS